MKRFLPIALLLIPMLAEARPPEPVLSGASQTNGATPGGRTVILTGDNLDLDPPFSVYFGTVPAKEPILISPNALRVKAPGHEEGTVSISLIDRYKRKAVLPFGFVYFDPLKGPPR